MDNLSSSKRKRLKSEAHHLKPVIQLGQKGITEALVKAVDKALLDHELIKLKFLDFKEEKKELAQEIADQTESSIIGLLGNILILYRENPDKSVSQ